MPRSPNPLPATLPWRVFLRAEALAAGVTQDRLGRSDLYSLRRGLYAHRNRPMTELDVVTALCRAEPSAVVVGLSAARLQGMPLPRQFSPWRSGTPVYVAVPGTKRKSDQAVSWCRYIFGPGEMGPVVYNHRGSADEPAIPHSTFHMTSRARTWRDLGGRLTHLQLVMVGDHLVRVPTPQFDAGRTEPLCTVEQLLSACTGRYAGKLRAALTDVRVGSDSPRETMLRLAFRDAGLPEPLINEPLRAQDGRVLHCPDFQWPEYRVCAEYEGQVHNGAEQVKRDIRRARRARSAGFHEVRLYDEDAWPTCAGAVRILRQELVERGWRP